MNFSTKDSKVYAQLLAVYSLDQVASNTTKVEKEAMSKDALYVKRSLKGIFNRLENDRTSQETANLLISFGEQVVGSKGNIISYEKLLTALGKISGLIAPSTPDAGKKQS